MSGIASLEALSNIASLRCPISPENGESTDETTPKETKNAEFSFTRQISNNNQDTTAFTSCVPTLNRPTFPLQFESNISSVPQPSCQKPIR